MSEFYNISKKKGPKIYNNGVLIANDPSFINFTGSITVTEDGNGIIVEGTGGIGPSQVFGEIVAGTSTMFTLAHVPLSGTLRLYGNGQRLTYGADYTTLGAAITTVNQFDTATVLADYQY